MHRVCLGYVENQKKESKRSDMTWKRTLAVQEMKNDLIQALTHLPTYAPTGCRSTKELNRYFLYIYGY